MAHSKNIILTTTPILDGIRTQKYLGIVTANVVMGVNLIKEFFASFSDVFGGVSGRYTEEMNKTLEVAKKQIIDKASSMGANAIVGVHIDYDELSGKEKSMLMVSIVGTAIIVDAPKEEIAVGNASGVTNDELRRMIELERIKKACEGKTSLPQETMEIIDKYQLFELAPTLFDIYQKAIEKEFKTPMQFDYIAWFPSVIEKMSYDDAVEVLYGNLSNGETTNKSIIELINKNDLFCPQKIMLLLGSISNHDLIKIINTEKKLYTASDITPMEKIAEYLDNIPATHFAEEKKSGLFSKDAVIMRCKCGTKVESAESYCSSCGANKCGFREDEVAIIEELKLSIAYLKEILK